MPAIEELRERLARVADLHAAEAVLGWDQETYMPPGSVEARAAQLTTIARIAHEEFTSDRIGELLEAAAEEIGDSGYDTNDASLIRVSRRDYERATKIPADLVARLATAASLGQQSWQRARQESSFELFRSHLETILELTREKAEALGYEERIYDPLLDEFEPGMPTADVEVTFAALREQLVPIVRTLTEAGAGQGGHASSAPAPAAIAGGAAAGPGPLQRRYDDQAQWDFGVAVMGDFGFDFEHGRQDRSAHPFTTSFSAADVRVTTRIQEDFLPAGLFGTLHECGHGLYEQGVGAALERTPLAGGASLGVHESQSRLWEILVGRARPFWHHYYPRLQKVFPEQLADVDLDSFHRAINTVSPSLIRVEADEVTYNLHVMLRFELENALLEGRVAVADLPEAWNDGMRRYLGVTPGDDAEGVLQDIHWSMGAIGYFPTYTLGTLMSAQIFARANADIPDLQDQIGRGEFARLLEWLTDNIYRHGSKFTATELLERMGCGPPSAEPWLEYVRGKYGELYGVAL